MKIDTKKLNISKKQLVAIAAIAVTGVVAIVRERVALSEGRFFTHDAVSFEDVVVAIFAFNHPASTLECDSGVGKVGNCNEVDKCVGRSTLGYIRIVEVDEAI